MALTRGEKKVSMPISAEAARLGTQQNKSNIFGALTEIVDPLIDLELQKQELEDKQYELSHTEAITNAKYHLDLERYNRKTIRALDDAKKKEAKRIAEAKRKELEKIEDAKNKNYVNSMKSLIQMDINRAVSGFKFQYAGKPDQFALAIKEWATGYTSRPEFPKQLVDRDGVIIGDFLLDFTTKLDGAYYSHYYTMKGDARDDHAKSSWDGYVSSFATTITDKLEQINQIGDHIDISVPQIPDYGGDVRVEQQEIDLRYAAINENWMTKMELIMNPLMKEYEGFMDNLFNLTVMYPDKYRANDVMDTLMEQKTMLDKHIVGAFGKFIISGDVKSRDKEHATALDFVEQWWRGEFNENSEGIGQYIHMWTSWADHNQDQKDDIKTWAVSEINSKHNRSKKGWSELVAQINGDNKARLDILNGNGVGSINDMTTWFIPPSDDEINKIHTKLDSSGFPTPNNIDAENMKTKLQARENLLDSFNLVRTAGENGHKYSWFNVIADNKEWGDEKKLVDLFYMNTINGPYNAGEILNRMSSAIEDDRPISTDPLLYGFSQAFKITNQYPSDFINVINSISKIAPDNEEQLEQWNAAIEVVNRFGTHGGLNVNTYDAFIHASKVLESGNRTAAVETFNRYFTPNQVEEKELIKSITDFSKTDFWLDNRIREINDHVTDQQTIFSVEGLQKFFTPKGAENYDLTLGDASWFGPDEVFGGTVPKQAFDWKATELQEALDANVDIINTMITEEATRLAMSRDINYNGEDREKMEQLFNSAAYNVFGRLNEGDFRFDWHMFDPNSHNRTKGHILTNVGISSQFATSEELQSNSIIQILSLTNLMSFEEASDFWETEDYGSKIKTLNTMFDEGKIKFQYDERSRGTDTPHWEIMIDVGDGNWKSLSHPDGYSYSWSPKGENYLTNTNKASIEAVKRSVISEMTQEHFSGKYQTRITEAGENELWFYVGRGERGHAAHPDAVDGWLKLDSKVPPKNHKAMVDAYNGFIATIGNNIELFKDVFEDWPDIDSWEERALENQLKVANAINSKKQEIENPDPIKLESKFKALAERFDIPNNNQIGNKFYVFDREYVDTMKNTLSYRAIGPDLRLDDNGIAMLKSLHTGKEAYTDDDIEKIINGEMGITVADYDKLLDIKYEEADEAYNELYREVILSPLKREVVVDIMANLGLDFAGPDSKLYKLIQEGNNYGVIQELKRMQPFYTNKSRHSYHVNMWSVQSIGKYN